MPRLLRIDPPGQRHHVFNRGVRRRAVFVDDDDYALFLSLLDSLPRRFGVRVHGYALMPNHYHLMLESTRGDLSSAMQHFGSRFGRELNRRHGWEGPVFRGRYHDRLVRGADYWRSLLLYLHLNPVRAGIARTPDDARWTSHRAYGGAEAAPSWLTTRELMSLFGTPEVYREELLAVFGGDQELPDVMDPGLIWKPSWAGMAEVEPLPSAIRWPSIQEALQAVAELAEVPVAEVVRPRRGRVGNKPRKLAAWWLLEVAQGRRREHAEALGMTPTAISRAASEVRHTEDPELAAWRSRLLETSPMNW